MQDKYRFNLETLAENYARFMQLDKSEQSWLLPLMSRGTQRTIALLMLISEKKMTFREIAEELECSPTTASQKINALSKGGINLDLNGAAFLHTGRPRKLVRKKST